MRLFRLKRRKDKMAFCTECGKELSDSASFCPNCGHKRFTPNAQDGTKASEQETYAGPAQSTAEDSAPVYGVNGVYSTTPPSGDMGYKPYGQVEKQSSSKAAVIVIGIVVVLLALAVVLFINISKGKDFEGYWESDEVDTGAGFKDEFSGRDVEGMFGLQLNEDGTYKLLSAFDSDIKSGTWEESGGGIRLRGGGDSLKLSYKGGKLFLEQNGYTFSLERSDRSIDDPTLLAGIYVGNDEMENDKDEPVQPSEPPASPDAPKNTPSVSGGGTVSNGEFYISIVGAEEFEDLDEQPAIRIYYEYTNNFDFSESPFNTLDWEATQDGKELDYAFCWENVEASDNEYVNVRPGYTLQCCKQYKYNPDGGTVDITFYGYSSGKSGGTVKASYVPGQLPGAPSPLKYEPITDPQWTKELDSEGYLDEGKCYVEVTDAELIEDSYGFDAIRVYYSFTNYGDEAASFYEATYPVAYQDGIGLVQSYAEISSDTDDRTTESVLPGKKAQVSCVFRLRNGSSAVEAEVEGVEYYYAVGQTYQIG